MLDFELVKSYIESRKYLNSPKLRLDPSIEHFVMVNENSGRYQQQRPPPNNERRLLEPIGGVRLQLAAIYYLQMAHEIISTQVFFRIFSYSGLEIDCSFHSTRIQCSKKRDAENHEALQAVKCLQMKTF